MSKSLAALRQLHASCDPATCEVVASPKLTTAPARHWQACVLHTNPAVPYGHLM